MAITRYEPTDMFRRFSDQMARMLSTPGFATDDDGNVVTSTWAPAVDVKEEDDRYVITADVPGVDPKDIEVTMENGILTLKGERSTESVEENENYRRILSLPTEAQWERACRSGTPVPCSHRSGSGRRRGR